MLGIGSATPTNDAKRTALRSSVLGRFQIWEMSAASYLQPVNHHTHFSGRLRDLDAPVARIFARFTSQNSGFTSFGIIGFILSLFIFGSNKQHLVSRIKIRKVMMGRSTGASRTKRANHGWLVLCTLPVPSPIRAPTHGRPSFHKGRFKILATLLALYS